MLLQASITLISAFRYIVMKQATGDFSLGEKSPVAYFANTDGSVHGFMQCTTSHSIVAQNATD